MEIFGGKVDFGETPEESIIREIKEEAEVIAEVKRLHPTVYMKYWDYPWVIQQTLLFVLE